jgi:sialic acid synthase SpsE
MLGAGKRLQPIEEDVRRVSRQSLVAARDLRAGERLEPAMLTVKRPGTGIEPWRGAEVIGRALCRDVAADHVLRDEDLA